MQLPRDPDIWNLLFEQTPTVLRYAFGVLTLGLFTLATVLYKWHRNDLDKMHQRMNIMESKFEERHNQIYHRMDEQNRLLVEIASNTRSQG